MQIEKLLEEQEKDFDRKCEIREDKGGFTYLYERDDHLSSEAMFNWHKQSLKQFIDGLVAWQQEEVRHPLETISHLKKLKEELN